MQSQKNTLVQEDTSLAGLISWKQFAIYGLWAVLLGYIGVSIWFGYSTQIWLTTLPTLAFWGIERLAVIFALLTLTGLTKTNIKVLTRFRLEQHLRFDVFMAVTEVVSAALARHLPDYQKLTTNLALGEELLRPAKQVSERVAKLIQELQRLSPGLGLAEAVDQIVRNSLQAHDLAVTTENVANILTRIETEGTTGNVVQLSDQRPSA